MRLCDVHNVPLAQTTKQVISLSNTYQENELITTHPIKKSDLGLHNNLFGGKL